MNLWITLVVELVIYVIMVFVFVPYWYIFLDDLPNNWEAYRWVVKWVHTRKRHVLVGCWCVILLTFLLALIQDYLNLNPW